LNYIEAAYDLRLELGDIKTYLPESLAAITDSLLVVLVDKVRRRRRRRRTTLA